MRLLTLTAIVILYVGLHRSNKTNERTTKTQNSNKLGRAMEQSPSLHRMLPQEDGAKRFFSDQIAHNKIIKIEIMKLILNVHDIHISKSDCIRRRAGIMILNYNYD